MIASLITGLVLGLSAGVSPGPLTVLVISQTLTHGPRAGYKVAFAPLITDAPIIALTIVVLTQLANSPTLFGLISLGGGVYLLYLAYESFRPSGIDSTATGAPGALTKGVLVNFLNPNPYIFWLSVGAPTIFKAWAETPFAAIAFISGFYVCLVGAKIVLAMLVGTSRAWFTGRAYVYLMRGLGVWLVVFAVMMARDGVQLLNMQQ
jgi:threonine/homoserine/homoserine lactone efflux protein